MRWMYVENEDGHRFPQWMRSAALDNDGTVFMPAAICGNEQAVFVCALFDGAGVVFDDGHLYVPTPWAANTYPDLAEISQKIERNVKRHFGT